MVNFASLFLLLYLFLQSPVSTGMSTMVSEMHITGMTNDTVTLNYVHVCQAAMCTLCPKPVSFCETVNTFLVFRILK